jgi:hypothetical protein
MVGSLVTVSTIPIPKAAVVLTIKYNGCHAGDSPEGRLWTISFTLMMIMVR